MTNPDEPVTWGEALQIAMDALSEAEARREALAIREGISATCPCCQDHHLMAEEPVVPET